LNQRGNRDAEETCCIRDAVHGGLCARSGICRGGYSSSPRAVSYQILTNAEFDAYLAHPDQVLLLDVRRPDEISTIGGFAVYLSIQAKDLKNHLNEIPRDRPIITVSNHAARASIAADLLDSNGFKVLGAVGADTYQKDGGTLAVKIPVPKAPESGVPGATDAPHPGTN
jgi:rhodanese-related sulfurtransferase